jgi:hypothetical protein
MWPAALLHHVRPDDTYSLYASPAAIAVERSALLEGARQAVSAAIGAGLGAPAPLQCERSPGRELVITLEAAIEHQMVPPLVALGRPCLLYGALVQLQRRAAEIRPSAACPPGATATSAPPGAPLADPWQPLRAAAEAFTLARTLSEKHLSSSGGGAGPTASRLYAGRLWLCLALARKSVTEWVSALAEAVPGLFSEQAVLSVADDRELLLALLSPLRHVSFALPETAAAARGEEEGEGEGEEEGEEAEGYGEEDGTALMPGAGRGVVQCVSGCAVSDASAWGDSAKPGIPAHAHAHSVREAGAGIWRCGSDQFWRNSDGGAREAIPSLGHQSFSHAPIPHSHSAPGVLSPTAITLLGPPQAGTPRRPGTPPPRGTPRMAPRTPWQRPPPGTPAEATAQWQVGDHSPPGAGGEPDLFATFLRFVARSPFQPASGGEGGRRRRGYRGYRRGGRGGATAGGGGGRGTGGGGDGSADVRGGEGHCSIFGRCGTEAAAGHSGTAVYSGAEAYFGAGPFSDAADDGEPAYVPFEPDKLRIDRAGPKTEEEGMRVGADDLGTERDQLGIAKYGLRIEPAPVSIEPRVAGAAAGEAAAVAGRAEEPGGGVAAGLGGEEAGGAGEGWAAAACADEACAGDAAPYTPSLRPVPISLPRSPAAHATPSQYTPRRMGPPSSRRRPPTHAVIESPPPPPAVPPTPPPMLTPLHSPRQPPPPPLFPHLDAPRTAGAGIATDTAGGVAAADTAWGRAAADTAGGCSSASASSARSALARAGPLTAIPLPPAAPPPSPGWPVPSSAAAHLPSLPSASSFSSFTSVTSVSSAPAVSSGRPDRHKAAELAGWLGALTRPRPAGAPPPHHSHLISGGGRVQSRSGGGAGAPANGDTMGISNAAGGSGQGSHGHGGGVCGLGGISAPNKACAAFEHPNGCGNQDADRISELPSDQMQSCPPGHPSCYTCSRPSPSISEHPPATVSTNHDAAAAAASIAAPSPHRLSRPPPQAKSLPGTPRHLAAAAVARAGGQPSSDSNAARDASPVTSQDMSVDASVDASRSTSMGMAVNPPTPAHPPANATTDASRDKSKDASKDASRQAPMDACRDLSLRAISRAAARPEPPRLTEAQARAAAAVYVATLCATRSLRPPRRKFSPSAPAGMARAGGGSSDTAGWEAAFLSSTCRALRLQRDAAAGLMSRLMVPGDEAAHDGGGDLGVSPPPHLAPPAAAPNPLRSPPPELSSAEARWAAAWLPARAMILQGGFDSRSAAVFREAASRLGVGWRGMVCEADTALRMIRHGGSTGSGDAVRDGGACSADRPTSTSSHAHPGTLAAPPPADPGLVILRYRLFSELAAAEELPLGMGGPGRPGGAPESETVLRRAAAGNGSILVIGVSGLLAATEGGGAAGAGAMGEVMGACWEAAASYFGAGEWWSLAWGGAELQRLAAAVSAHSSSSGAQTDEPGVPPAGESRGIGNPRAGWRPGLGGALALRGAWVPCMEAARGAGALLAAFLRGRRGGDRPVCLMGVGLGARVVW